MTLASGEVVTAHSTNTGSMTGCCEPGSAVYVSRADNPKRKLKYTWELIKVGRILVCINTLVPNRMTYQAIKAQEIAELTGYQDLFKEVTIADSSPKSRIDLMLADPKLGRCYVEIKNVTLAEDKVARFPDAVTTRGRKHLLELLRLKKQGHRAVIFFFVARADCDVFAPADEIDSEYGETLREVVSQGVEALAYRVRARRDHLRFEQRLDVLL